jgi:PAS domain S-box-containing protein
MQRYGVALLTSVLVMLLAMLLWRWIGPRLGLLFVAAAIVSAWYGGLGPGLFTTLFCLLVYPHVIPPQRPAPANGSGLLGIVIYCVVTGGSSWLVAAMRDARRRTVASTRALQASEEQYRRLIDTTYEGVVTLNLEAQMDYVNPRMSGMLGYSADELQGRSLYDMVDESERPGAERRLEQMLQGGGGLYDLRLRRSDGSDLWALVSTSPILDEHGAVRGALAMVTDVTERRRAEEEVHKLNAALERRVRERTSELETVNKELEAFVYSVSHDLRTPLRGIDGFSQALLEEYAQTLGPQGTDYLRRVRAEPSEWAT